MALPARHRVSLEAPECPLRVEQVLRPPSMPKTIWLTGLPGSGKSTVAGLIKQKIPHFIILSIDALRKVVTPQPTYSDEERELVYRSLVYTARMLTKCGHDVIIDATGNRQRWRDLARELIPDFVEVYLRCPLGVCQKREKHRLDTHGAPKDIYKKGEKGWPVPGIVVPYEEPHLPNIVIDMEKLSAKEAAKLIIKRLNLLNIS